MLRKLSWFPILRTTKVENFFGSRKFSGAVILSYRIDE
jgi:hypothetical protein